VVRAEIPGVDAKDIELTYQEGVLRISGEKKENKEEKGRNRYYRECRYGYFSKGIPLENGLIGRKPKPSIRTEYSP
jgi:HSP20 family protein